MYVCVYVSIYLVVSNRPNFAGENVLKKPQENHKTQQKCQISVQRRVKNSPDNPNPKSLAKAS